MRERYDRAFAPIFVIDFGAVLGGDRARTHSMNFSISVKLDFLIVNLIQIVNQMIIYLDYGKKKDLGMVLFADDRPREEIVVKQADSRKIIFLNCYPYDDNSKVVVFDRLRNYTESYV